MRTTNEQRTALCARVEWWAQRLNVEPPRVRIQRMTRKWGSCSTSGTLSLASDLVDREMGFIDFVIAHELLHLRVPNHGKLFKALMNTHVPNWKKHDTTRRRTGTTSMESVSRSARTVAAYPGGSCGPAIQ